MLYAILAAILAAIYVTIGTLLFCRRGNASIRKRAFWLVYATHWSNLGEVVLLMPMFSDDLENTKRKFWQFRQGAILIFHYFMYFAYLLRSYRVFALVGLSGSATFMHNLKRITQKALLFWLGLLILPVFAMGVCIFAVKSVAEYAPLTDSNGVSPKNSISNIIYVTLCFTEELILILFIFKLRFIEDKYNMNKELLTVSALWYLNPLFSAFINLNRSLWIWSMIIRNLLLMLISSLLPLVLSYREDKFEAPLTLEMLESLEIVLQNKETLRFFEKFLIKSHEGLSVLEFYQKCVCDEYQTDFAYNSINDYFEHKALPNELGIDEISDSITLEKAKEAALRYLEVRFYSLFVQSEEYRILREIILRKELIENRVRESSFYKECRRCDEMKKIEQKHIDLDYFAVGRLC
jgi:hypothetical protein